MPFFFSCDVNGQAQKNRTKKIFVGGVPVDMQEQEIKDYFQQFGDVSLYYV